MRLSQRRGLGVALGFGVAAVVLSGCSAEITVSGSGTNEVTIRSNMGASDNTVAYICRGATTSCNASDAYAYVYRPPSGSKTVVASPGFAVEDRSGDSAALSPGRYTVGIFNDDIEQDTVTIELAGSQERDLTIWHKSVGRDGSEATCPEGHQPSWAQWPNDGTGGFVCNQQSYAYYPDTPVATGQSQSTPWRQSIARTSADDECPSGYRPGWAQWPNDGTGGFTCTRDVR